MDSAAISQLRDARLAELPDEHELAVRRLDSQLRARGDGSLALFGYDASSGNTEVQITRDGVITAATTLYPDLHGHPEIDPCLPGCACGGQE